ncbi:small heat shock protein, chloroplastic-like [Cynara cardunculus var. scolymus]|uniref:Alpha crystallin/Hsp20 domain-containing protein n=1 Tax=Cynara cardunculus var. scolymus TaxID=59895 RepID=A0A103YAW3_CYNCS|nr:small heat shock protein, chloroplastic-like [Cynara cardunculus var. scolymus]KVI05722.1 Alpha crystallin/Hsp20 domain-containing protein [Cynara cardunculus var. scolymus]
MAQSQMTLPLFSQRITTPKSNPSSVILIPNTHKKNPNFTKIIKSAAANGDHLQSTGIKNQQQKQLIKKRPTQSLPIGLWDRFPTARTVQQMMDTMERLMEDPVVAYGVGGGGQFAGDSTSSYSRGRTPWEIKEGEDEYKMRFDMPGMKREDVKVWVEEKMLVLKAEKMSSDSNGESNGGASAAVDDGDWSAKSYGKYSFRIALPENIQFEKIKAEVRDGVLYVTIPKAPLSSKILDINVQ